MIFGSADRKMIRLGVPPNIADLLNFAGEESFEKAWEGRVHGEFLGVSVNYPSRAALIEMKRSAGRPQDLVDIGTLEEDLK